MYLGEIIVPANDERWVTNTTYRPEPPIVVRGALDPYNAERKRAVWIEEEAAWKIIVPLQTRWRALEREFLSLMTRYNALVGELDNLMGGGSGLMRVKGPLSMVVSPVNMVFSLVSMLSFGLLGGGAKKKKKRMEQLARELEALQIRMVTIQTDMNTLAGSIQTQVERGRAMKAAQQIQVTADLEQNRIAHTYRQTAEQERAASHQSRALLYERLSPTPRQGVQNAL